MSNCLLCFIGWLCKYGGRPKSWKRLWFILSNNCLYFFKFTTDKTPKGIIPLENILVRVPQDKPGKLFSLILYKESPDPRISDYIKTCKTLSNGETVKKNYSSIQLGTSNKKERDRWVQSVNANHSMSRFYSDLTLKKMQKSNKNNQKLKVNQDESDVHRNKGVRKSQISLPATVLANGDAPVPAAVLLDPTKDPKNFFIQRNLSSISLANSLSTEEDTRSRSKSESRLYDRFRSQTSSSSSPSVSTLSHTDSSFSRDIKDLDCALIPVEKESTPILTVTSPVPNLGSDATKTSIVNVDDQTSPSSSHKVVDVVIHDQEETKRSLKLTKKLSNIVEADSTGSVSNYPHPIEILNETSHKNSIPSSLKRVSEDGNLSKSNESQPTSATDASDERTSRELSFRRKSSSIPKLSTDEDGSSTCSSIDLVQYSDDANSNSNVRLLNYKTSTEETEQKLSSYLEEMYFENMYESNV
jgi:hypothetical protein